MEEKCALASCNKPLTEADPVMARGMHSSCYQRVIRAERRQRVVLGEARLICEDISERYGVVLVVEKVGDPFGMNPVDWVLLCVDEAIRQRLQGPNDLPVEVLAPEA